MVYIPTANQLHAQNIKLLVDKKAFYENRIGNMDRKGKFRNYITVFCSL